MKEGDKKKYKNNSKNSGLSLYIYIYIYWPLRDQMSNTQAQHQSVPKTCTAGRRRGIVEVGRWEGDGLNLLENSLSFFKICLLCSWHNPP